MRLIMTEEMLTLWNEIKPFYDEFHHLRADAPDEIKKKREKLHEMRKKQWEEAMIVEIGFVPEIKPI